jgi:ketosteroid isomerase-like protein
MSQEILELGYRAMATLSRGDLPGLIALADPEVEWHSFFAELGEGGVYHGHDGTRHYLRDLKEAWEVVRADIDDGLAVGDVALFVGRIHYRGKGSGIETETAAGWMLRFRQGKVLRFRAFREPGRALGAVGLSE